MRHDECLAILLESPHLTLSANTRQDVESGQVDARLLRVIRALIRCHSIAIVTIATGHPMGPTTRNGTPNAHYFYRAMDIYTVDGVPVAGHATDTAIMDVGRLLEGVAPHERPDRIMGPGEWHEALGYGEEKGFVSDAFHNRIHADHLHIGFSTGGGADNRK